jgi:putative ABC transport system permease protein
MWTSMFMGLRNIKRRIIRTILTIMMLMLGTLLIVFSTAMNEGPYADMIRMATNTWNGQVQVLHYAYKDSPSMFETINQPNEIIKVLTQHPEIQQVTARIETAGLLSLGTRTVACQMTGVDPKLEPKVSTLANTLSSGTFLDSSTQDERLPIVIGDGMAQRLQAKIGSELIFMGSGADGSMVAEAFKLVGILDSGLDDLDASLALIRLKDAQELFVLGQRVHRIVAKASSSYINEQLKQEIQISKPNQLYVWDEIMPEVAQGIEQDRKGGQGFMFIIMLMVLLGTINTLLMSVFERTKELGVMRALGTPRVQIMSVVLWEALWMSLIGVGLGVGLGTSLVEYLAIDGIKMFEEAIEFGGMQLSVLYPMNTLMGNVIYPLCIVATSILGSAWPAWRASCLDPVTAIRQN